jgi:apolipoprotein D and lipocalin family protein
MSGSDGHDVRRILARCGRRVTHASRLALALAGLAAIASAEQSRMTPVPTLELQRYAGTWYEIARLPNPFQKKCAHSVMVRYAVRDDGRLGVVNECVEKDGRVSRASGVARLADPNGPPSRLKVRFAPAFLSFLSAVWGDYWVIDLAPDYSYAVVGEPKREYLWILSRSPQMPETLYAELLGRAARFYDVSRVVRTAQSESPTPAPGR